MILTLSQQEDKVAVNYSATAQGHHPTRPRPRARLTTGTLRARLCLLEAHGDKTQCNLMQSPSQHPVKVICELLGLVVLGTASLTADSPAACLWLSQEYEANSQRMFIRGRGPACKTLRPPVGGSDTWVCSIFFVSQVSLCSWWDISNGKEVMCVLAEWRLRNKEEQHKGNFHCNMYEIKWWRGFYGWEDWNRLYIQWLTSHCHGMVWGLMIMMNVEIQVFFWKDDIAIFYSCKQTLKVKLFSLVAIDSRRILILITKKNNRRLECRDCSRLQAPSASTFSMAVPLSQMKPAHFYFTLQNTWKSPGRWHCNRHTQTA